MASNGDHADAAPRALAYTSVKEELSNVDLKVEGTIPRWLHGTFCRTGPAMFEIGIEPFRHWFDGQSMLYAYTFNDGKHSEWSSIRSVCCFFWPEIRSSRHSFAEPLLPFPSPPVYSLNLDLLIFSP